MLVAGKRRAGASQSREGATSAKGCRQTRRVRAPMDSMQGYSSRRSKIKDVHVLRQKEAGTTRNSNKCELRKTGSDFAQRADTSERTNCNIEPKRLAKKDAHSQRETARDGAPVRWRAGRRCRPCDVANWPPPSATRQCSSLLLTNGH